MPESPEDRSLGRASLTGYLLVASPRLVDAQFHRAVVLMLDHDRDGALGVILNRPTEMPVLDVLPVWGEVVSGPRVLFSGGPVSADSALGLGAVRDLSAVRDTPVGWKRLYERTGLVDLDTPAELIAGALAGMRIYVGYAGWSASQLEDEIDEGAWYVVPAEPADVFDTEPGDLWRRVLRRQSGELAFLSTYPDDTTLN